MKTYRPGDQVWIAEIDVALNPEVVSVAVGRGTITQARDNGMYTYQRNGSRLAWVAHIDLIGDSQQDAWALAHAYLAKMKSRELERFNSALAKCETHNILARRRRSSGGETAD